MGKNKFAILLSIIISYPFCSAQNRYVQYPGLSGSLKTIEKVYLHTDRDYYSAGDDLWFKAYLIDASDRLLSSHSNNLHVELISPDSRIVESQIIRLEEGLGIGDFRLSVNLKSGLYRLRAYTNYMRNFGDQLFFFKGIAIINSLDTNAGTYDSTNYYNNKLDISFFPEGGSLVDNVTSIIAFKAVNAHGEGCDVSGQIYSSAGDLVKEFKSTHLGMGTFSLRPIPGRSYYGIVKNQEGDEIRREFRGSFSTGIVLRVSLNQDNEHLISISTNPETLPLILNNELLLSISKHKTVLKTLNFKLQSLVNSFILPVNDLPDGIFTLTLSGSDSVPLCERLIYIQNKENIKIEIETSKTEYKPRDSVSVRINISDSSGIDGEAFLSFSACEKNYTFNASRFSSNISSWFLLESDVHGPIEEPSNYFDPSNPDRLKDLDLLLCTHGWRDFDWKYEQTTYLPENGFTISGKVRKLLNDSPLKNAEVTIGIFKNENSLVSNVPTDSSGRFSLENIEFSGNAYLTVSSTGKSEKFQGWLVLDSLKYLPAKLQNTIAGKNIFVDDGISRKENLTEIMKEYEIIQSTRKKYSLSDTILLEEVQIVEKKQNDPQAILVDNSRILYGSPDQEIVITAELERYTNIRDLLIGRASGLTFTESKGDDSGIRIRGMGSFTGSEPAFMLDGMIVPYSLIRALPVSWIDRIDVLKSVKAAAFGMRGANGIIAVITKSGDRMPYQPVRYSTSVKISGYNEPRVFYSPRHYPALESDYKPDFRATLFWEPDIKLATNEDFFLNYYNADYPSVIKIVIEGITSTGIPVTGMTEYKVQ